MKHDKRNERYLQSVLDCVRSGIMAFDTVRDDNGIIIDFQWTLVNQQAQEIVQRHADALLGKRLLQEMPGNREEGLFDLYVQVVETGQMLEHEHYYEHENVKKWFYTRAVKLGDGFVVSFSDITRHKQDVSRAQENQHLYQSLFEQAHDAVFMLDLEGRHIHVNSRAADMLGYTVEEIQYVSFRDISADADASSVVLQRLMQGEKIPTYERVFRKKDGTPCPVEINVELIRDGEGKPKHIQSVVRDISQRKQAEKALRQSEERYRQLTELMSDYAIFSRIEDDGTLELEWITGRFEEITGYPSEAFNYQMIQHAMSAQDMQRLEEDTQKTINGQPTSGEYQILNKRGKNIWLYISRVPAWDDTKSKVIGIYSVGQDITAHKQAQQRKLELALEKERRVLFTQFIQNAAHEFRTPLAIINSNAYLLKRLQSEPKRHEKIDQIETQVDRINQLVDALLMTVRLESSGLHGRTSMKVAHLLQLVCDDFKNSQIDLPQIQCHNDHEDVIVKGDAEALKEALKQIILNASQFTPRDGYITIKTLMNAEHIMIEVHDTGVGIAEEYLPDVFRVFWRQDTARTTPGFGLGLPIAQRIAQLHGGEITLESQIGQGTVVRLSLPLLRP